MLWFSAFLCCSRNLKLGHALGWLKFRGWMPKVNKVWWWVCKNALWILVMPILLLEFQ